MASTIKIKNSSTASAVPTSSDLVQGELAVNVTDKRIYTENASGTVVELGINPSSLTNAGNLTFTGTGNRITGDYSNATIANRVAFQTSTTNGVTVIGAVPNGTSTTAANHLYNGSDLTNYSRFSVAALSTEVSLRNEIGGTGSYLPMTFYTGGSERMRIDTSGNVGIGTSSPATKLDVAGSSLLSGSSGYKYLYFNSATENLSTRFAKIGKNYDGSNDLAFWASTHSAGNGAATVFYRDLTTESMRIDSSGNFTVTSKFSVGPTQTLYLAGAALVSGAGTYPLKWNSSTGLVSYDTSSRISKTDIVDATYGLAEVLQLRPRKYIRIDSGEQEVGFIADEVIETLPEFVPMVTKSLLTGNEEDVELVAGGVNYDKLTAVLVKAIQEQQAIITSLTARIEALEA